MKLNYPEDGWFVKPETSGVAANPTKKDAFFSPNRSLSGRVIRFDITNTPKNSDNRN